MTVSSTNTKNSYSGNGSTTVFAYTFKIFDDDDITVILRTDATGGETVQTKTTDYTVSGVGNAGGGNITFGTAPASGITVVLIRETAQTQATDYTPNDPFPAASHEDALDKLTLIIQDQQEELDRSIKVSRTNTITSSEFTVGATDRANRIFAFDSNGDLSVTQEIGTYQGTDATTTTSAYAERDIVKSTTAGQLNNVYICIQASPAGTLLTNTSYWQLLIDAVTAATSATNAAASATAAAASETAAAASESAAATSESNAATSASNASTSATNAATSATASAASASAASTSETNAATSATNASNSATAAASSATAAASSATAAAASESAAATSETNAATSASNAATSESNAATSESNAATSASNAATSATNAETAKTAAEAARDAIQQFYLGAQSSNPTVDGNGDPVTAGDWYFNTTDNTTRIYDGSAWNTVSPDLVGDTTPQLGGNLDTNGNDITFGDNDKATFGDAVGGDLRIYHNPASGSYIEDAGVGNLIIKGTSVVIDDSSGDRMATFVDGGAVTLNHGSDASARLATTSGGIDVQGTVTADELYIQSTSNDSTVNTIQLAPSTTTNVQGGLGVQSGGIIDVNGVNNVGLRVGGTRFLNVTSGGDISFYDSTGVTQGFFWDASTQRLGLGTTSPSHELTVSAANDSGVRIDAEGNNVALMLTDATTSNGFRFNYNAPNDVLTLDTTNGTGAKVAELMRITSGGNVVLNNASYLQFKDSGGTARDVITIDAFNGLNINSAGGGSAAPIVFKENGSEIARFHTGGQLIAPNGITLGTAVGTYNAANTLDDYEEGTWTPKFTDHTGSDRFSTYSFQIGTYTKIGNTCLCSFDVSGDTGAVTSGTYLGIGNLPFNVQSGGNATSIFNASYLDNLGYSTIQGGFANPSPNFIYLVSSGTSYVGPASLTSGSRMIGGFVYLTA